MAETLAALLSAARSRRGWSLRDAEKAAGVQSGHLSQIETGKIRQPGIMVLMELARAYEIPWRRVAEAAGHGAAWVLADEAGIRASERERCASRLRSVSPADFAARHGLQAGAGAASVLAAAAAEVEGSGDG